MSKLDEALDGMRQNLTDGRKASAFYDLFLNSTFFVPVLANPQGSDTEDRPREILPLITESDGKDYLMLFSSFERLREWVPAEEEVPYVEVAGHLLALTTTDSLYWALNVGTEYSKQFNPGEIAWLREAVESCNADANAEAEAEPTGCCG
ncbi:SseB family protein [Geomesophilobacter sediminis]|uniref:SseB family protein n=1 Tax=Geomesophilobacter sediminis TaxID=2798584 RepID=A0A8J7JD82_9BACT|nr:SseB family protein [Geomesophilobacter sediminis]MBJ6723444.1 SseB family protein [Geomesophilobacter sediminis]